MLYALYKTYNKDLSLIILQEESLVSLLDESLIAHRLSYYWKVCAFKIRVRAKNLKQTAETYLNCSIKFLYFRLVICANQCILDFNSESKVIIFLKLNAIYLNFNSLISWFTIYLKFQLYNKKLKLS